MNHLGYGIKMLLVLAGTVVIVGGCASNEISAKHIDREGIDAVIVDNAAKVTYIKENGHTEKFCAYRDADVESVAANGFSLGVSTGMGSESIGENSGHGALALGGRSPAVLIVRELMYRACELSMNLNADQNTTLDIYKLFLSYAADIAKNEHDGISAVAGVSVGSPSADVDTGLGKKVRDDDDDDDEDEDEE